MNMPLAADAESPVSGPVVIRQLDSPWMLAQDAALFFRVSVEEIYRGVRLYEDSKHRQGLKCHRRTRLSKIRVHHDDVLLWLAGEPPTRGTRKYPST